MGFITEPTVGQMSKPTVGSHLKPTDGRRFFSPLGIKLTSFYHYELWLSIFFPYACRVSFPYEH